MNAIDQDRPAETQLWPTVPTVKNRQSCNICSCSMLWTKPPSFQPNPPDCVAGLLLPCPDMKNLPVLVFFLVFLQKLQSAFAGWGIFYTVPCQFCFGDSSTNCLDIVHINFTSARTVDILAFTLLVHSIAQTGLLPVICVECENPVSSFSGSGADGL